MEAPEQGAGAGRGQILACCLTPPNSGCGPSAPLQAQTPFQTWGQTLPALLGSVPGSAWGRSLACALHPSSPPTPHLPCSDRRLPLAAAQPAPPHGPQGQGVGLNGNAAAGVAVGLSRGPGSEESDPLPQPWPSGQPAVALGLVLAPQASEGPPQHWPCRAITTAAPGGSFDSQPIVPEHLLCARNCLGA